MSATSARARTLACILALLLASLFLIHGEWLKDQYKTLTLRPLEARCDSSPPEWLAAVGRWAARHDFRGIQIHVRINGATYDCSFGERVNTDGSRDKMEKTTKLPYASVTKVFASTLVMKYVQQGLLHEEQPIYDALHLGELGLNDREHWQSITLGMLLRHQGGFDRTRSGDPMIRPDPPCPERLDQLRAVRIDFEPGTSYAYSNLGYCLAGLLVERATNRSLPDLYRTEIFEPYGLSIVSLSNSEDLVTQGIGLDPHSEEREQLANWPWKSLDAVGNLAGTARDIGTFLYQMIRPGSSIAHVGQALLKPLAGCDDSIWRKCHGPAFYSFHKPGRGRMFWRDGTMPGVTAFAAIAEDGDIFVLLGNARDPQRWVAIHDELGQLVYDHL